MDREDLGRAEQAATRGIGRSMGRMVGRMVLRLLRLGALLRGFASTTRSRSKPARCEANYYLQTLISSMKHDIFVDVVRRFVKALYQRAYLFLWVLNC
jgi:hypothetical protein